MAKEYLTYHFTGLLSKEIGKNGIRDTEYKKIQAGLRSAKRGVIRAGKTKKQGWMALPSDSKILDEVKRVRKNLPRHCTHLLVLGIGGSDLGARAILEALKPEKKKGDFEIVFAGSSTNPDDVYEAFSKLPWKKTCVNIVSKSGGTLEPMSNFLIAREQLIKAVGKKKFARQIIATTDPESGSLRQMAIEEEYHLLSIPQNVGGRFSVMSAVGLFPAYLGGVDIDALQKGARDFVRGFEKNTIQNCVVSRYAGLHFLHYQNKQRSIHVLMAYSQAMREFTRWYRQLIAESLGKAHDKTGKQIFIGLTPVASIGPEDQHSQLQLYEEGPMDKLITFLGFEQFANDMIVPEYEGELTKIKKVSGFALKDAIRAEMIGTMESLKEGKRPVDAILLKQCDAYALGQLFLFFELATAVLGELLRVNAYDQPGVERSKQCAMRVLSNIRTD